MLKTTDYHIAENGEYGYFEVVNKPTQAELNAYYAQKYYQPSPDKQNQYKQKYTETDLAYIKQKISQKYHFAQQFSSYSTALDLGCGEGHAVAWLLSEGLDVLGVDYSDYGYQVHHPEIAHYCRKGHTLEVLDELIAAGATYDLIWLDNVLEHVIDPARLLQKCQQVASPTGHIVIEVPNDYSRFQAFLKKQELISRDYWVAPPDHLNYFSPSSLSKLCQSTGWSLGGQMGDFPIELFLLNSHSNYCEERKVGKGAHQARMRFNDFLTQANTPDQTTALYQALLQAGVSRQIIGVYARQ